MAKKKAAKAPKKAPENTPAQPAQAGSPVKTVIISVVIVAVAAVAATAWFGFKEAARKAEKEKEAAAEAARIAALAAAAPTPTVVAKPRVVSRIPAQYRHLFGEIKTKEEMPRIHLEEAKVLHASRNVLFIDARGRSEYNESHIPGAISIPAGDTGTLIPKYKDQFAGKVLVPYCHGVSCNLSVKVANALFDAGYRKIVIYFGGWPEWSNAKMPLEKEEVPDQYKKLFVEASTAGTVQVITPQDGRYLYDSYHANFVDVEEAQDFGRIHIDRSISIPLSTMDTMLQNYSGFLDQKPVVLYGHDDGKKAKQAAEKLFNAGHKKLLILQGGMSAWESLAYPLNRQ